MSFEFFIEMAWKSVLISGLALLIVTLLRSRSPADRAAVLRLGLVMLFLLPLVAVALPALEVETTAAPALVQPLAYAPGPAADLVARRAAQARDIGVDGIVCAAPEAQRVRALIGPDRLIVTPGIRPAGSEAGDQKRILTPAEGIRLGASHLVVARPIIRAADPRAAAEAIVRDIAQATA